MPDGSIFVDIIKDISIGGLAADVAGHTLFEAGKWSIERVRKALTPERKNDLEHAIAEAFKRAAESLWIPDGGADDERKLWISLHQDAHTLLPSSGAGFPADFTEAVLFGYPTTFAAALIALVEPYFDSIPKEERTVLHEKLGDAFRDEFSAALKDENNVRGWIDFSRELLQETHGLVVEVDNKVDELIDEQRAGFARMESVLARSTPEGKWNPRDHYERPPATGPCFGRETEIIAHVTNCCLDNPPPGAVLGGPGIGKSALARAVLNHPDVIVKFGWRRFWVNCETVSDHLSLTAEAARVIGLPAGPDPEPGLMYELQLAPALLILDNLETPLNSDDDDVCQLLARLVGIDGVSLIATCRGDETPGDIEWYGRDSLQPLAIAHARNAFCYVAGAKVADDPLLDKLLNAVECVPLAISLLAHQARGRSDLKGIWERWNAQKTRMLRRGKGDHRLNNLEVSIELSIALLDQPELRVLSILALLPAGCDEFDLADIAGPNAIESGDRLRQSGLAELRGNRLYSLAPIREYVLSKYRTADVDIDRTTRFFCGIAITFGSRLAGSGGREAAERIAVEYANIRATITKRLDTGRVENVAHVGFSLGQIARVTGLDCADIIERLANAARNTHDIIAEGVCAQMLGDIALSRSNYDAARAHFEKALPPYRRAGSLKGEAQCIQGLGEIALIRSDHCLARTQFELALGLFRQIGDWLGQGNCVSKLGGVAFQCSDHHEARLLFLEAVPLFEKCGGLMGAANCMVSMGDLALARSDHDDARASYESALPIFRHIGSVRGEANCIQGLGEVALMRSDFDGARAKYEEATLLHRRIDDILGEAQCMRDLGQIALMRYDHDTARANFEEGVRLSRQIGSLRNEAVCIRGLGDVALALSELQVAYGCYVGALQLYQRAQDQLGEANCIRSLGDIALSYVDLASARGSYEEALHRFQKVGDPLGEATCIRSLGEIALMCSDLDTARRNYDDSLQRYQQVGDVIGEAKCIERLGAIAFAVSDYVSAGDRLEEALLLYRQVGYPTGEALCIMGLGDIALARSDNDAAKPHYHKALELYVQLNDAHTVGRMHVMLARMSSNGERAEHVAAAREAWTRLNVQGLTETLDEEFGTPTE